MIAPDEFIEHVEQQFGYLASEFGFQLFEIIKLNDSVQLEYRSDRLYVRIIKTVPDFEPYLIFGRNKEDGTHSEISFFGDDISSLKCCQSWEWQRDNTQPFNGRVVQLARLLKDCGSDILRGAEEPFNEMLKRRKINTVKHTLEEKEIYLRRKAESAWKKKDYVSIVSFYREIEDQLTPLERKRLSYAVKNSSEPMN